MDPALSSASTPAPVTFEDGLGSRRLAVDRARNEAVEMLCLRSELTSVPSFEFGLRERLSHLAAFSHACYNRVRGVERLKDPASTLAMVSDVVVGTRLSEILRFSEINDVTLDIDAALCLLRQLVPAIAMLHENMPDIAHGALGAERLVVTPNARLIVVEHALGSALEQLRYSQERYWRELRVAVPRSAGLPRFDHRADATQLGVVALSLILGRQLHEDEVPARLADLVSSAWAVSARGGLEPLPAGLRAWMMCALQLDARNSFESAIDAQEELERVLGESDYLAAPASLEAFLDRYRAATEPAAAPAVSEPTWPNYGHAQEPLHASVPEPKPILGHAPIAQPLASQPVLNQTPVSRPVVRPLGAHELEAPVEITPIATPTPASSSVVRPPSSARVPVAAPKPAPLPSVAPSPAPASASLYSPIPAAPAAQATPSTPTPAFVPPTPTPSVTSFEQASLTPRTEPEELFSAPLDVSPFESPQKAPESKKRWGLVAAGIAILALAGAGVPAARRFLVPNPAANDGILIMTTNPPGAKLFVDGVERGITPLSISLKAGAHALEVRGDGPARVMPIAMTAGAQVSQYIELPKVASTAGQLQVRTEPSGARVSVDGVPRGVSPVTVPDLTPGEHAVSLESDRGSVKQIVAIEAGITASLMVPIATATDGAPVSGWIAVTAPADVQVFENKRLIGSSQSDRLMVSAGKHDIEIVNETLGYRTVRSVQVAPGKVSAVKLDFPKGTIALNALPWAEVWVDGEKVGDTPIGNLSLTIGSHEILFRHPDLGEQRHAATVTLNSPARLSVDLRKK